MSVPTLTLERQADALARAQKQWHADRNANTGRPANTAWSIALSREAGVDGSAIAHEVGQRLAWSVYDRELVECIAREMGLRSTLLESVDEKQKSWLIECVESMTAAGSVTEAKFVKHLVETLHSLSKLGDCVIVGRGAVFLLPATNTLRVRLVGARRDRVKNVQRRRNLSEAEADRWVDQTDRDRANFVQEHFYHNPADPGAYDLVLNTSRWTNAECTAFIVEAVKKLQSH